jgi:hypothetical protein
MMIYLKMKMYQIHLYRQTKGNSVVVFLNVFGFVLIYLVHICRKKDDDAGDAADNEVLINLIR